VGEKQEGYRVPLGFFPGQWVPESGSPLFDFVGVVQIMTKEGCNRKCEWCPNSYLEQGTGEMSFTVFSRIMNELKRLDYKNRVHLHLMNEPLRDRRIFDFIGIARAFLPYNVIGFFTNGDYLSDEVVDGLKEAGLTGVVVSCYEDPGVELIPRLIKSIEKHRGFLNFNTMDQLKPTFYNRGGLVPEVESSPVQYKHCEWIFNKIYINYKGDLVLCCSDYEYEVVMGNVMEQPLDEIFNCELYREYRQAHISGDSKTMPLCDKCNRVG